MPKTNLHNFIRPLTQVTLEPKKAQSMRASLAAYADMHAVMPDTARAVTSPFYTSYRLWGALVAVAVLLIGTTGVSFAAENTVPGDPLYVVKVSVAEPIQGALMLSTESKAKWSNQLADRRLNEAAELAAENRLTASTTAYIQTQVQSDVAKSAAASDKLAVAGDDTAALSVRSDLAVRLAAHADLLAFIAPQLAVAGDATTTSHVLALLDTVHEIRAQVSDEGTGQSVRPSVSRGKMIVPAGMQVAVDASATDAVSVASSTVLEVAIAPITPQSSEEHALFDLHKAAFFKIRPPVAPSTTVATSTASTTTSVEASSSATVDPDLQEPNITNTAGN